MNDNQNQENIQTLNYNTDYNANIPHKSTGLGLSSMLIGILGLFLCCCLLFFNSVFVMLAMMGISVAGLMMGIVAVTRDRRNGMTNGMGIAGIIMCAIHIFAELFIISIMLGIKLDINLF